MNYAVKFDEDDDWKLLNRDGDQGPWKVMARGSDPEELGDEIFELIQDDEFDAGQVLLVQTPAGRKDRRAAAFCTPDQRRELGYVIDDKPVMGRPRDRYDG